VATVLGLIQVAQAHARNVVWYGRQEPISLMLRGWMPDYYIWAALTPLVVRIGRAVPLERGRWVLGVGAHILLATVFAAGELLASSVVVNVLIPGVTGELSFLSWYGRVLTQHFVWGFLIYWVIQAAGQALAWFRHSKEQEIAASELEAKLATAQLRALKMQLHPHFLFNTLHSIGVLVRKNERSAALDMVTGLGDLLRASLENTDRQEIPLKEELEFLERYLEIEQIRFRDRLRVRYEVDSDVYDAAVPNMILQPLVENAIRHGVAPSVSPRTVRLEAERLGGDLVLRVRDDGVGVPEDWTPEEGSGVGIRNVRERLERHYGDRGELRVRPIPEGGVRATVRIPFRKLEDEEETASGGTDTAPMALTAGGTR
jgi:signal transduction histidine kinase